KYLQEPLPVGVLQREAAAQHLQEHAAELLRGDVVQQRVHHRAEVEEDVGDGKEGHVGLEVGVGPVLLGFGGCHDPPDLDGHPFGFCSCISSVFPFTLKNKHNK
uniref:Uncharacterized protein n=1 Tax=Junco hyemalis TaxID=40217 RepID=A0A8C5JSV6_JUNHY